MKVCTTGALGFIGSRLAERYRAAGATVVGVDASDAADASRVGPSDVAELGYDGVDESWPVRPDGHRYVDTKIASEQVVLQAHAAGEIAATVVRPADVYGPGSIPWTIWPEGDRSVLSRGPATDVAR